MRFDSSNLMIGGAILVAVVMAVAQEANKEWKLKTTGTPDILRFTVRRFKPGSEWSSTRDVPRSHFRGLSIETLEHGGPAKFEYVEDAGSLACTGRFSWTGGSGDYTFVPNPQFADEMHKLGYMAPDRDQQFSMMIMGVTLDFARGVKDAGLRASTEQLIDLRAHGVTMEYIAEARRGGYQNFLAQDFIEMRDHGVRSDFLRDLKTYGYNLDARGIVMLRDHGVNTEFIRDLKQAGYDLPAREITELRDHGVSTEYLRELRDNGLRPKAGELTQLRDHGVTPEFLKGIHDAGYDKLDADEIVQLRDHGVEAKFAQQAHALGYNFTPRELVQLRDHGVTAAYLRNLRDSGMPNLTAQQIEKLRENGVE
jgi:hypothetical protein